MAHNGGPRVPPRPPAVGAPLSRVHQARPPATAPRPPSGRAPAIMSIAPPPLTAPLSPLLATARRAAGAPVILHPNINTTTSLATAAATTLLLPRREHPAPPVPPISTVTLSAPRPDGERTVNEYVETPFRPPDNSRIAIPSPGATTATTTTGVGSQFATAGHGAATAATSIKGAHNLHHHLHHHQQQQPQQHLHHHHHHHLLQQHAADAVRPDSLALAPPVTKQPVAATFTKARPDPLSASGAGAAAANAAAQTGAECTARGSIICPECGRCRCESCQQPRPLPQRWVCDKKCLCSVGAVIDYVSCLCCVKGFYYHCSKDYELERDGDGVSCADEPCSCVPHRRAARWGCLAALTAVLPCLLCYWPLRGCARGLEAVYARHARSGCRCAPRPRHQQLTPEKRLLDSSPEF